MSLESKLKIAEAFEKLLQKNSILKISVSDITEAVGLSRQTFYNNFLDIYDLVYWMHSEHLREIVEAFWENEDFCHTFETALHIMRAHKVFYEQAIRKKGINSFQELFYLRNLEQSAVRIQQVADREILEDERFLLDLYWRGAAQMVADWISSGMQMEPVDLACLFYEGLPQKLQPYWPNKTRR